MRHLRAAFALLAVAMIVFGATGTSASAAPAHDAAGASGYLPDSTGEFEFGGMPATSYKIVDQLTFNKKGEKSWFLRGDLAIDVPVKGAEGFGLSFGHIWSALFADLSVMFYQSKYGAVKVYQQGVDANVSALDVNAQIALPRSDNDTATIFTIGPGVGYVINLFGSEHWSEFGRVGASFVQYQDTTNSYTFRGGLGSFQGGVLYHLTSALSLGPAVDYNVGFMSGQLPHTIPNPPPSQHDQFLPIQWWSWHFSVYVWL